MKHIKLIVTTLSLVILFTCGSVAANPINSQKIVPPTLYSSFAGDACKGLSVVSTTSCTQGANTFKSIARNVVGIMSYVIGAVAVIMLIIAGFKYVIAGGDTNAITSAKNTLIYALVGLAIAVLAQALVHWVLNTANTIQKNSYLPNHSVIKHDG
jgi:hypothetical protein